MIKTRKQNEFGNIYFKEDTKKKKTSAQKYLSKKI